MAWMRIQTSASWIGRSWRVEALPPTRAAGAADPRAVLGSALDWLGDHEASTNHILGFPFTEHGLRLGVEASLRGLARAAPTKAHRYKLIDMANRVRPTAIYMTTLLSPWLIERASLASSAGSFATPQLNLSQARSICERHRKQIARNVRHSWIMAGQSDGWITTARVLRRAGFGTTGAQVDAVAAKNWSKYVDAALNADPEADLGARATPMPTLPAPRAPGKGASAAVRKQYFRQVVRPNDRTVGLVVAPNGSGPAACSRKADIVVAQPLCHLCREGSIRRVHGGTEP